MFETLHKTGLKTHDLVNVTKRAGIGNFFWTSVSVGKKEELLLIKDKSLLA